MECMNLTSEQIGLLSEAFFIYSAFGIVAGLFFYDLIAWIGFTFFRRFRLSMQEKIEEERK